MPVTPQAYAAIPVKGPVPARSGGTPTHQAIHAHHTMRTGRTPATSRAYAHAAMHTPLMGSMHQRGCQARAGHTMHDAHATGSHTVTSHATLPGMRATRYEPLPHECDVTDADHALATAYLDSDVTGIGTVTSHTSPPPTAHAPKAKADTVTSHTDPAMSPRMTGAERTRQYRARIKTRVRHTCSCGHEHWADAPQ